MDRPTLRPDNEPEADFRVLDKRNPAIIRIVEPVLRAFVNYYYRASVEGVEHLSANASLIVSTHNGIWTLPDLVAFSVAFLGRFGTDVPAHAMVHKIALALPGVGKLFSCMGGLPASPANGLAALRAGRPLLVCPGGDMDAMKPFSERHTIHFGHHRGFIKLALKAQVPIIPVVSVGAHETLVVLNDGRRMAQAIGFARFFRIRTVPLTFSFPLGLGIAGVGAIPFPAKVSLRILPPIDLGEPASAAEDPVRVERCFELVRQTMQEALTDLASRRKYPFFG